MGNTTRITSLPLSERQTSFSPLTGQWVIRPVTTVTPGWKSTSFSPLTGKWVIRPLFFGLLFVLRVRGEFQSPYGEMGNTTQSAAWWKSVRAISFSPLTGKWVIRHVVWNGSASYSPEFQSPYGEMGNTTLSLSTRSGSGPTGDFFKPRAFFAFFGDPGSKPKSDSVVFSLSYAIFSPF